MTTNTRAGPSEPIAATATAPLEYWTLWYPKAAAKGMLFARGKLARCDALLVHAAPDVVTVEISDVHGNRLAYGADLRRTETSPMCLFHKDGRLIVRQDLWPEEGQIGLPVMVPGGEVGILESWWHSDDRKEWRWRVEYYNSIRREERTSWSH